jgi:hypothetical protein
MATLKRAEAVAFRYCGSIVLVGDAQAFVVGYPKIPGSFVEIGWENPAEIEAWTGFFQPLCMAAQGTINVATEPLSRLRFAYDGELAALAEIVVQRLIIARNGSVSERLWNLCLAAKVDRMAQGAPQDDTWLIAVPERIWQIVREDVLKCS